jgi:hypothetical protein
MLAVQSAPLSAPTVSRALGASRRSRRLRAPASAALTFRNLEVSVDTHKASLEFGVGAVDITGLVRDAAAASGVRNGLVTVISKHTTTAVCVNENESRLFTDIQVHCVAFNAHSSRVRASALTRRAPDARRRFCCSLPRRCPSRDTGTTTSTSGAPHVSV